MANAMVGSERGLDIHLDPLGGWSGDMFVAAMLDAFPDFWPPVQGAVAALDLGPDGAVSLPTHRDHALTGHRFLVAAEGHAHADSHTHAHLHARDDHHHHHAHDEDEASHRHRAWSDIRAMIADSRLDPAVKDHAIGIFRLLAQAEGEVHGVAEDAVTFHEVGAADSIIDIVAAAQIIALVGPGSWSAAPLPLGSGRVKTRHGILPVPAPATALLLRGLATIDDGIPGERVTPTGAAVARYLLGREAPERRPRRLVRTGIGFGARNMPGISNCLRVLAFEPEVVEPEVSAERSAAGTFTHRELGVIAFEVDDLSAEDLAHGLDHIRALPGVHDVIQSVAFGKKGRIATQVQVLAAPEVLDAAIEACFTETTTIGLRFHIVQGAVLPRHAAEAEIEDRGLRVKLVQRPGGMLTAKTEAADVAAEPGHARRVRLRRDAETLALGRAAPSSSLAKPGDRS